MWGKLVIKTQNKFLNMGHYLVCSQIKKTKIYRHKVQKASKILLLETINGVKGNNNTSRNRFKREKNNK